MRTRTLLLLAVSCGLAILVAGLVLLLRIDRTELSDDRLGIGDTAQAGDLSATVVSAEERDGFTRIEVRLGGVDDDSVSDDFRLIVPGQLLSPLAPSQAGPDGCGAVAVSGTTCELVFGTADIDGSARSLVLRRGEDQRRWDLALS
ncbi:MAG: hypothetical protein WD023_09940 [Ilumatobacteraceae bacterium]